MLHQLNWLWALFLLYVITQSHWASLNTLVWLSIYNSYQYMRWGRVAIKCHFKACFNYGLLLVHVECEKLEGVWKCWFHGMDNVYFLTFLEFFCFLFWFVLSLIFFCKIFLICPYIHFNSYYAISVNNMLLMRSIDIQDQLRWWSCYCLTGILHCLCRL